MRRSLTFLVVCGLNSVVFGADQPALNELMRMQNALQNLNYHGTMVYVQNGHAQSMRVIHKAGKDGEFEKIVNLNGSAREVIRKDDVVTCYMPDSKAVTVGKRQFNVHALSRLAGNDFSAIQKFYHFELEANDRVAGLQAQRVLIKPRDTFRYGYRLWLDKNSALLLKSDLLDVNGETLEQAMFAEISIVDQIPMEMLEPSSTGKDFGWYEQKQLNGENQKIVSGWIIKSLPDGFAVSTHIKQSLPDSEQPAEHWVVTDGLAGISVYVEKMGDGHQVFEGFSQTGPTNLFGLLQNGYQITVVGEVPAKTVEIIARSIMQESTGPEND